MALREFPCTRARKKEPPCGAGIALFYRDELLLVHEMSGKWGIPKGQFEGKNESAAKCASREICEELNVIIDLTKVKNLRQKRMTKYIIYFIEVSKKPIFAIQDTEISKAKWFSVRDLVSRMDDIVFNAPTRRVIKFLANGKIKPVLLPFEYPSREKITENYQKDVVPIKFFEVTNGGEIHIAAKYDVKCKLSDKKKFSFFKLVEIAVKGKWCDFFANFMHGNIEISDNSGVIFKCRKRADGSIASDIISRDRKSCMFNNDSVYVIHHLEKGTGISTYIQKRNVAE